MSISYACQPSSHCKSANKKRDIQNHPVTSFINRERFTSNAFPGGIRFRIKLAYCFGKVSSRDTPVVDMLVPRQSEKVKQGQLLRWEAQPRLVLERLMHLSSRRSCIGT